MIDCSINILDLVYNHPEDVRSTFGIGEDDNLIILAPDVESGCIFRDNRVDDYTGDIKAYILIGRGYIPNSVYCTDGEGVVSEWPIDELSYEYGIYVAGIKDYGCNGNNSIQVGTYRERFWVDVTICDGSEDLGQIVNGGRYVGYGDNITISAMPNEQNYTTIWTDITDPEHPIPLPSETSVDFSRTIFNITSNRRFEVCFIAIPKRSTFRLFTNDGRIDNLNLSRMVDGYKLGDVSVTFEVDGEDVTISTENSGYGVIKTYDFNTGTFSDIIYTQPSQHALDRGIILYNLLDTQELTVSAIQYTNDCCYVNCDEGDVECLTIKNTLCETPVDYTTFKGWVNTLGSSNENYNNLSSCNLIFPEYIWEQIEQPLVDSEFIHTKNSLPSEALCGDYYYISTNLYYTLYNDEPPPEAEEQGVEVPPSIYDTYIPPVDEFTAEYVHVITWITPTQQRNRWFRRENSDTGYFSRSIQSNNISLNGNCYEYLDSETWQQDFTQSFSEDITFYAIFEPNTSTLSLKSSNIVASKNTIGIIDYCNAYEYFEIAPSEIPLTAHPMGMNSIPLTINENSYEYIRVGNTYYQKQEYYRESGATIGHMGVFKEIIGTKIFLKIMGNINNNLVWSIVQGDSDITHFFNGSCLCQDVLPYECPELNFIMCKDIIFLIDSE